MSAPRDEPGRAVAGLQPPGQSGPHADPGSGGLRSASRRLLRATKRRHLREALAGTDAERWGYCWARQVLHIQVGLLTYGLVRHNEHIAARRIQRNYDRLRKWAKGALR